MTARMRQLLALLKSTTAEDFTSLGFEEALRMSVALNLNAMAADLQLERPLSKAEDAEQPRLQ